MTQTLRRELRLKFLGILSDYLDSVIIPEGRATEMVDRLVDTALEHIQPKPKIDLSKVDPAWAILAGVEITQEQVDENVVAKEATDAFEKELGFGTLPWNSDDAWVKFYKFVVRVYRQDNGIWADYAEWREGDGKYGKAMTNNAIRKNPKMFMDTGYPTYEARKMYRKDTQPEYKKVESNENETQAVPNPYGKPSILRK